MVSRDILSWAAASFGFKTDTLALISESAHTRNHIYRFTQHDRRYILRLSERPPAQAGKVAAEIHWVSYLADNGVRTPQPIRTTDGQLCTAYRCKDAWFFASAFQMALGVGFDKNNPELWGPALFSKWGETMGKIHQVTKAYDPGDFAGARDTWRITKTENPYLRRGKYRLLINKLERMEAVIESLPKDVHSYGLIHHDFHPRNFLIDDGDITVFDFDDSIYGWFALDIGIAAAHAVWSGSPGEDRNSKREFAQRFLNSFLAGYAKHNTLDQHWIERIPMFMDYTSTSSFMWWLEDWDGDESHLNKSQRSALAKPVDLIQKGLPFDFDGCDVQL